MEPHEKRRQLEPYLDQRVNLSAMFEKFNNLYRPTHTIRCVLVQDGVVEVEGKELDIGHLWIQHAHALEALELVAGDRIKCNCRVGTYQKRHKTVTKEGVMVTTEYNLHSPTDCEATYRVPRPGSRETRTMTTAQPVNGTLRSFKELAEVFGKSAQPGEVVETSVTADASASDLLRPGEAADLLGVTVQTLRNWDHQGKLRATTRTASGERRYRRTDVETVKHEFEQEVVVPAADPIQLLTEFKCFVERAGGWDRMMQMAKLLKP